MNQTMDAMTHFQTQRYAEISTCHITEGDAKLLLEPDTRFVLAVGKGTFAFVPDAEVVTLDELGEDLKEAGFSEAFRNIFQDLQTRGISYVRFDDDAEMNDTLPFFEW